MKRYEKTTRGGSRGRVQEVLIPSPELAYRFLKLVVFCKSDQNFSRTGRPQLHVFLHRLFLRTRQKKKRVSRVVAWAESLWEIRIFLAYPVIEEHSWVFNFQCCQTKRIAPFNRGWFSLRDKLQGRRRLVKSIHRDQWSHHSKNLKHNAFSKPLTVRPTLHFPRESHC